jgi:hypothetical protein
VPVRIQVYGVMAEFRAGVWSCEDDSLRAMLEALVDPRACTPDEERAHALYAAGRLGGMIAGPLGWELAPHPEAEIRMEDLQPAPRRGLGLRGLFGRKS